MNPGIDHLYKHSGVVSPPGHKRGELMPKWLLCTANRDKPFVMAEDTLK